MVCVLNSAQHIIRSKTQARHSSTAKYNAVQQVGAASNQRREYGYERRRSSNNIEMGTMVVRTSTSSTKILLMVLTMTTLLTIHNCQGFVPAANRIDFYLREKRDSKSFLSIPGGEARCPRRMLRLQCNDQLDNTRSSEQQQRRRQFLGSAARATAAILTTNPSSVLALSDRETMTQSTLSPPSEQGSAAALPPPRVTDRVFFNVRISRQDGTFYVRDDLPDTPENKVFYGRLVLELFGDVAPNTVAKFKNYVGGSSEASSSPIDIDNPLPTYSRSNFPAIDPATGVLAAGKIPGLEVTDMVGGATALRYGGRLLPANLWVEASKSNKLSHNRQGLLTHRILEPLPIFGITTRSDTTMLDNTHIVFGRVVLSSSQDNDGDGQEFLRLVGGLPTYSETSRPINAQSGVEIVDSTAVVDEAAQALFQAQRTLFRNAAKSLGDTRLDKVYNGKLLRRVEVTQAGFL